MVSSNAASSATHFQAGAARLDITPPVPVWLGGYASRRTPSAGVVSNIYVRALALQDPAQKLSLIVAIDQVGPGRKLAKKMVSDLAERFALASERIVLAFSHSHSAPVCDRSNAFIYEMPDEYWKRADQYGEFLNRRVLEAATEALQSMRPAQLHFGQGLAGFGVNRRRSRAGCRHLPGPVDQDVPVLRVRSEDGQTIATMFGYACHTTTLALDKISADYAGFAAEALENAYPGSVALYIAGCGADINPLPRRTVQLAKSYGEILFAAVQEVIVNENLAELSSPLHCARAEAKLAYAPTGGEAELQRQRNSPVPYFRRWAESWGNADRLDAAAAKGFSYPIQVWRFGGELVWIQLADEPTVDYALRFKAAYGWERTWASGYCDSSTVYIPSERVRQEGGYEGGDCKTACVEIPAAFAPGLEEKIAEEVDRLIKKTEAHA